MTNLVKLPGLIDIHVHLRDPGATYKEDFYTGTCAAIAGGVVAIIDMPNNPISTTSLLALKKKEQLASKKCVCDYGFYFGADQNNWLESKKVFNKVFGLKIYLDHTTGSLLIENLQVLENHFKYWPKGKPILVHAEDSTLAKAIGLASTYNQWLHVCHVSQASELELIRQAKLNKLKITCETTPHYLFLNKEDEQKLGNFAKMRPQLRTKKDQQALWQAINNGLIDCLVTDHAPHTIKEKKSANFPYGIPGLETMLPLMLTAVNKKKLTLKKLIQLTHINPAKFFGIKINNSWIEVDLDKKWIIDNNNLKTKCGWSSFAGWQMTGKVVKTFIRGKKVFENGQILVNKGFGKAIKWK